MKWFYPLTVLLSLFVFLLTPLFALPEAAAGNTPSAALPAGTDAARPAKEIRLKKSGSGEIVTLAARDYVFGAVAAEMPMTYSDEALKAQAVVCYTYALYKAERRADEDYDLTDDPATDQAYITRAEAIEKWGDQAEAYAKRLDAVAAETEGMVITYNGDPILAACHDTSCGRTQPAAEVWGGDYPYLISVESAGDLLSPSYISEKTVSAEEFAEICKTLSITAEGDAAKWVTENPEYNDSGSVKTLNICGTAVKGTDVRSAFSLRSAAFDITYSADSGFTFTVRGYGHGVGMSQTGANYMALCGSDYGEILAWYYPNTKLTAVSRET